MIGRWIAFGLFLLGALLLQILYDGYLGGLLLPIALALPVLSLLLSVPALARAQIHIAPTAQKAADGSPQSSGSVEFDTEVRLDQPDSGLRVGMNVRMTVVTAERKGVWAVPYDALVTDAQGQTAVYVARPQGEEGSMVAVEVPVDTGLETDFYVEISSGQLAEGDLLLTQPAGILPGAPVTLAPAEGSGL